MRERQIQRQTRVKEREKKHTAPTTNCHGSHTHSAAFMPEYSSTYMKSCSFLIIEITRKNLQLFLPFSLHLFLLNHFQLLLCALLLFGCYFHLYSTRLLLRWFVVDVFSSFILYCLGCIAMGNLLAYRASTTIMIRHTKWYGDGGA